jgi:hypothetical protein
MAFELSIVGGLLFAAVLVAGLRAKIGSKKDVQKLF